MISIPSQPCLQVHVASQRLSIMTFLDCLLNYCWPSLPMFLRSESHRTYDPTLLSDGLGSSKSKLYYDRRSLGRPFWYQVPSGAQDHLFVTVRQVLVCWCAAPSLARERVCRLQLLVLASTVILGPESLGTHDLMLLSQIRDSLNLEGQVTVCISIRNSYRPQRVPSFNSQACGGNIRTRLHTGLWEPSRTAPFI
jgi:hypothetical protein